MSFVPKRAHLALNCLTKTGVYGTFLFASERPEDEDPVSPVFNTLGELATWARANDWHRMGPGIVGDYCKSDSAWFRPGMEKNLPRP